jgi:hypothetical protein
MKVESTNLNSQAPRFVVGIDLGTTNCAMAFVDTRHGGRNIADFPIRQFTASGVQEARDTLPSFLYALTSDEASEQDQRVDAAYRTGVHAREHGALTPGRLITSAKSWLCHGGVDRRSRILPWHAADNVKTLSPVEAQAVLLKHMRNAWDEARPDHPLSAQEVFITVPASFDEVARELTIEAARLAGLPALILLEEPQAAFYAWLAHHEETWSTVIAPDDHILVCDVGGGTTDLTLIHARPGEGGPVVFHRMAVGDHLILGGDNLDLALAHALENRLSPGVKLDPRSWSVLIRRCRHYKEYLLAENSPESVEVVLPGVGSRLLSNQRTATLTKAETEALLLDGFMPMVEWSATPAKQISGFQEFGLPYAPDPAITRYVAEFLRLNLPRRDDGSTIPPRAVLLNGGLFESPVMRRRFYEVLASWFSAGGETEWNPARLDHRRLDLAVARGAAYFGLARRGLGVRVVSHLARSYYLGIETGTGSSQAICVAPASLAAGEKLVIKDYPLAVRLKTPVEFPLYVSSRRTTDTAGQRVTLDAESFTAMPPLRTVLAASAQATQSQVHVHIATSLTELGTLDLVVVEQAGARSWKLAFDLRAATRTELTFHDGIGERTGLIEQERLDEAAAALREYFSQSQAELNSNPVMNQLEQKLDIPRAEWPVSVLRAFWRTMLEIAGARATSAAHEQRWLNLAGYCLRPGFGFAVDDWRIAEMWKVFPAGVSHQANEAVCAEWWIMWRRLAGGLSAGQQQALAMPLFAALKTLRQGKPRAQLPGGASLRLGTHESVEVLRLLSMLERIERPLRELLGSWMVERMREKGAATEREACLWATGRLGSRVPLYGPLHNLVSSEQAASWLESLLALSLSGRTAGFTLVALARFTGDRYRDIPEPLRVRVAERLASLNAPGHWIELVMEGGKLEHEEQTISFGDSLPKGLFLADRN